MPNVLMVKPTIKRSGSGRSKAIAQLKALLAHKRHDLAWHHAVGRLVAQLVPQQRHYLQGDMPGLIDQLGLSSSLKNPAAFLYQERDFALTYDERQLSELKGLTAAHISALLRVENVDFRAKLQRQCIAERWSYRDLRLRIQGKLGKGTPGKLLDKKPPRKVGVKIVVPEIVRESRRWLRDCPKWLKRNQAKLAKLLEQQVNLEVTYLLDQAEATFARVEHAAQVARKTIKEIQAADRNRRRQARRTKR